MKTTAEIDRDDPLLQMLTAIGLLRRAFDTLIEQRKEPAGAGAVQKQRRSPRRKRVTA
jgi:hypothetical protein